MPDDKDRSAEWANLKEVFSDLGGNDNETRRRFKVLGDALERIYRAEQRRMRNEGSTLERTKSVAISTIVTAVVSTLIWLAFSGKIPIHLGG